MSAEEMMQKISDLQDQCIAFLQAQLEIMKIVEIQSQDDGLWFDAQSAPEAHLQQGIKDLHDIIKRPATGVKMPQSEYEKLRKVFDSIRFSSGLMVWMDAHEENIRKEVDELAEEISRGEQNER